MGNTVTIEQPHGLSRHFDEAVVLAHEYHRSQVRKGTSIPYVAHLLQVAGLVIEAGGDEEQAIAALLHDAIEDAAGAEEAAQRRSTIRERFGQRVLRLVEGCTDGDPAEKAGGEWRERKRRYLDGLRTAERDVLLLSVSDKLHNARAILRDYRTEGEDVWRRFKGGKGGTLWYYRSLADFYGSVEDLPYAHELSRVVAELEANHSPSNEGILP